MFMNDYNRDPEGIIWAQEVKGGNMRLNTDALVLSDSHTGT